MPWYKEWFNSPYYHTLYGKRDGSEAESLVANLLDFLRPDSKSVFLDLACGQGRHARQIAQKGFETWGIDLSPENIEAAKSSSLNNLRFEIHDMRQVFKDNYFDFVFNLFTSFGYFDSDEDSLQTLESVRKDLKSHGIFVQDYFNTGKVMQSLVPHENKTVDGIHFEIDKHISEKKVFKSIKFHDHGVDYRYCEQVSLYDLEDFKAMYKKVGFELLHCFGDYNLNPYDEMLSDRLILISKKI